ncbi:hypothetical protein EJ110_NYTH59043 [Nymphaea thermarum]|nr:hypothetical protein EJ110_NYTH59043 [Nymphaea thermarum]
MVESTSSVVSTDQPNIHVQVTTIRLIKDNYLQWSAAFTMGIVGWGRIAYVNGKKIEQYENSPAWGTWFFEDNQVKTWIINSVSFDIQPLILRKRTVRDMWVILEQMYGQKKKDVYSRRRLPAAEPTGEVTSTGERPLSLWIWLMIVPAFVFPSASSSFWTSTRNRRRPSADIALAPASA